MHPSWLSHGEHLHFFHIIQHCTSVCISQPWFCDVSIVSIADKLVRWMGVSHTESYAWNQISRATAVINQIQLYNTVMVQFTTAISMQLCTVSLFQCGSVWVKECLFWQCVSEGVLTLKVCEWRSDGVFILTVWECVSGKVRECWLW